LLKDKVCGNAHITSVLLLLGYILFGWLSISFN